MFSQLMNEEHQVRQLAKEITASYETRVAFVQEVVKETQELLARFQKERERMANELREALAKSESLRKKDFNKMMEEILAVQHEREEGVKSMLQEFKAEEEGVATRLQGLLGRGQELRLKDFKRTLAQIKTDQQKRTQDTVEAVTGRLTVMQEEVGRMLGEFKQEREKMKEEWTRVIPYIKVSAILANQQTPARH